MTKDEKIRIAKALKVMKVDIIEAGFPIASNGKFESVHAISGIIKGYIVNGQGANTDIIIASAKSYINALNKVINRSAKTHPQMEAA